MEGCPGYWERDSNCHGYCSPATCKGSEPGHLRNTKRNLWLSIHSTVPARMVSFYAAQRTWLAELAESVPVDRIPQLRPLQSIRMLRDPYIARRSPDPAPLKVKCVSWTLSSVLSARRQPPHSLCFAFFLLSHYIAGSVARPQPPPGSSVSLSFFALIVSQVPFLARCTSLPVFPFSQTHLFFIPILAICFGSFHHYGPLPTRLSYTHSCSCRNCILWDCLFPWSSCNMHTYHRCRWQASTLLYSEPSRVDGIFACSSV